MDTPLFYVLLFVHLSGLVLAFGSVMVTDLHGLLWAWNRVRFTQVVRVSGVTEWFIWIGWGTLVAAGIPLLLIKGQLDNLMVVKLFFVALVGLNGIPLHWLHKRIRGYQHGDDVPRRVMFRLMLALSVSQLGWWSAMLIGFLHRHVQTVINWPDAPALLIGAIVGTLLVVWVVGERITRAVAPPVES